MRICLNDCIELQIPCHCVQCIHIFIRRERNNNIWSFGRLHSAVLLYPAYVRLAGDEAGATGVDAQERQ